MLLWVLLQEVHVIRENSDPGDIIILLGGRTGRDGCRRCNRFFQGYIQRLPSRPAVQRFRKVMHRQSVRFSVLFRRPKKSARLIKKCNDFGAGGVSVAIGELADGLQCRS